MWYHSYCMYLNLKWGIILHSPQEEKSLVFNSSTRSGHTAVLVLDLAWGQNWSRSHCLLQAVAGAATAWLGPGLGQNPPSRAPCALYPGWKLKPEPEPELLHSVGGGWGIRCMKWGGAGSSDSKCRHQEGQVRPLSLPHHSLPQGLFPTALPLLANPPLLSLPQWWEWWI